MHRLLPLPAEGNGGDGAGGGGGQGEVLFPQKQCGEKIEFCFVFSGHEERLSQIGEKRHTLRVKRKKTSENRGNRFFFKKKVYGN